MKLGAEVGDEDSTFTFYKLRRQGVEEICAVAAGHGKRAGQIPLHPQFLLIEHALHRPVLGPLQHGEPGAPRMGDGCEATELPSRGVGEYGVRHEELPQCLLCVGGTLVHHGVSVGVYSSDYGVHFIIMILRITTLVLEL